jgi:addiction module HigA family antidote
MSVFNNYFTHPGIILKEEFMEPLGIRIYQLAQATGMSRQSIEKLVNGTMHITKATATCLSNYFGNTVDFWLNLQQHYDQAQAPHDVH